MVALYIRDTVVLQCPSLKISAMSQHFPRCIVAVKLGWGKTYIFDCNYFYLIYPQTY